MADVVLDQLPVLVAVLGAGALLGLRHAMDADHIAAMSTLIARTGSVRTSLACGAIWGTGHTFTLLVTGILILAFRLTIPEGIASALEVVVGLMLVWLGGVLILHHALGRNDGASHHGRSTEEGTRGMGARSFVVGAVHGLAGSAALLLLVLSTIESVTLGIAYILFFGVGSIAGMLVFSGAIALPIAWTRERRRVQAGIRVGAAALSVGVGILVVFDNLL
jgi:hypothetical protein